MLLRRVATLLTLALAPIALSLTTAGADGGATVGAGQAAPPAQPGVGTPREDARHGLIWKNLRASSKDICGDEFELDAGGHLLCTHGPDAPEDGRDVRERPTSSELQTAAAISGGSLSTASSPVPCYGDGTSGNRVQAIYARASDVTDRYSTVAPLIAGWAGRTDEVFDDSAAETGGSRHVRFVTTSSCQLVVQRVQLSTTGDDSLNNTVAELRSLGFTRTDRKYLLWVDANVYCGISGMYYDDQAGAANANNKGPSYSRVDAGCWGGSSPVEAHELMHALGGVQLSALHSSGHGHCTDESDRMCYSDASGVTMTQVCPSTHEARFDCNHDDYYSTAPASGSYLATHWNTASSSFLSALVPTAWNTTTSTSTSTTSTSTTSSTSTSTTSTTAPAGTTTKTFSGSFGVLSTTKSFSLTATGAIDAVLTFTGPPSLTLTVSDGGGVIGSASGASPVHVVATARGGTVRFKVGSATSGSFRLTVRYTKP